MISHSLLSSVFGIPAGYNLVFCTSRGIEVVRVDECIAGSAFGGFLGLHLISCTEPSL